MTVRILLLVAIAMSLGCSKSFVMPSDFQSLPMVHYSKIGEVEKVSNHILYLDKGDEIPIKMAIDSDLFDITTKKLNLVLKQRVYLRLLVPDLAGKNALSEKEKQNILKDIKIFLSLDRKNWAPYTDHDRIKDVFGIQKGYLSVGMGLTKNEGMSITFNLGVLM